MARKKGHFIAEPGIKGRPPINYRKNQRISIMKRELFESTGRHEGDGYWEYVVGKLLLVFLLFSTGWTMGYYLCWQVFQWDQDMWCSWLWQSQLRGIRISACTLSALLFAQCPCWLQCSPSFPFDSRKIQKPKPVTLPCLEQLPRTEPQLWALNLRTEHWIRTTERRAVFFSLNVFIRWLISPGFSKVKTKLYHIYRRELELRHHQEGWGTGQAQFKVAKGWGTRIQAFSSCCQQTMVLLTQALYEIKFKAGPKQVISSRQRGHTMNFQQFQVLLKGTTF